MVTASSDGTAHIWPTDFLKAALERKTRDFTPDERDHYEIGSPAERRSAREAWEATRWKGALRSAEAMSVVAPVSFEGSEYAHPGVWKWLCRRLFHSPIIGACRMRSGLAG